MLAEPLSVQASFVRIPEQRDRSFRRIVTDDSGPS